MTAADDYSMSRMADLKKTPEAKQTDTRENSTAKRSGGAVLVFLETAKHGSPPLPLISEAKRWRRLIEPKNRNKTTDACSTRIQSPFCFTLILVENCKFPV